ncbi:MAG: hypothetical protein FWD57_15325, partial [Polyangiaceae bacterium]|nr:hypothetical protein [Polyangiaceae bacterium]
MAVEYISAEISRRLMHSTGHAARGDSPHSQEQPVLRRSCRKTPDNSPIECSLDGSYLRKTLIERRARQVHRRFPRWFP